MFINISFRLCAVFGGVYCLKRFIKEIYFSENDGQLTFDAIQCNDQRIEAKNIVFGHGTISSARFEKSTDSNHSSKRKHCYRDVLSLKSFAAKQKCGNISRGIFITDTPIGDEEMNKGYGGVIFLKLPSSNSHNDGAFVTQLSHWSGCCPKDFCTLIYIFLIERNYKLEILISVDIIHITCPSTGNNSAKDDLAEYVEKLFKNYNWQEPELTDKTESSEEVKPQMVWSMYFNIPICLKCEYADETPIPGLHLTCGPYYELDYDKSIEDVRENL